MTREQPSVRTVIVDDHDMVATALSGAIHQRRGVDVVGVATTIEEGVDLARRTQPSVLLVDYRLEEGSAERSFEAFRSAAPACGIVVVTGWPSEQALFTVLDAGATGFVAKDQPVDELLDAVVRVAAGEVAVCPQLLPALVRRSSAGGRRDPGALTDRELEVLEHLSRGEDTRAIAQRLAVSPNTVRNHVTRLMLKLDVHSRLEAVSEGVRRGIIGPRGSH